MNSLNPASSSLSRRALWRMGIRIAIVVMLATLLAYGYLYRHLKQNALTSLQDYVAQRGELESQQFLLAETQTAMMTQEFLRRYAATQGQDFSAEFNRIFERGSDGLWRVRAALNDYRNRATVFVRHDVPVTPDLQRRVVLGYQLLSEWGRLTTNRFLDSFINMPEQLSINYAPFTDWSAEARPDTDIYTYETVWRSTPQKNPQRRPFWTGVYFDEGAKKWMVSHVTPGDYQKQWVVSTGQDIVIDDLLLRTANQQLSGTYNIIVRTDGELIAHPLLMDKIKAAGGNLKPEVLGDKQLQDMISTVLASKQQTFVSELEGGDYYLGVSRIKGPGWLFVTVYPASLVEAAAFGGAWHILALGLLSLLVELWVLYLVLRRQVAAPINELIAATDRLRMGDTSVIINMKHNDELGSLAKSFNAMVRSVVERDAQLLQSSQDLSREVMKVRANEARLHAISQAVPDPIFVVAHDGVVLDAFGNRELYHHRTPTGRYVQELLPVDLARESQQVIQRCLETGEIQIHEYPLTIDGVERWFEGHVAPLPPLATPVPAVVWLARDITDRKAAEMALIRARDQLEDQVKTQTADLLAAKEQADAANLAKTHFLSNMSHELRTPMHAILSFAKLALDKVESGPPEKLRRYMSNIVDAGERLLALVNDLLDITKLESGKMVYNYETQPLWPVIEETVRELGELSRRRGLRLQLQMPDHDTSACFDRLRIGQVLRNLFSNAIKFTAEGSSIQIAVELQQAPLPSLRVSVCDEGMGIPENELESIFDKFIQSSKNLSSGAGGGTGLGLAISREIVRHHGGDIWAENRGDGGACFVFWIPLVPPQSAAKQVLAVRG
ncbi:MAG: ATP-binding protein [Chitinivorax sp.]